MRFRVRVSVSVRVSVRVRVAVIDRCLLSDVVCTNEKKETKRPMKKKKQKDQ